MKFLQQLTPLLEPHETALAANIEESSVIRTLDSLRYYTARDIADFAFLHFLVLFLLQKNYDSAVVAKGHAKRTLLPADFKKFTTASTDLHMYLHILLGGNRDRLRKNAANDLLWNKISLRKHDAKDILTDLSNARNLDVKTFRFLMKLEKDLHIEIPNYRSCRRLISDWEELETKDQKLVVTRLLQALRVRSPASDILVHLEHFAKHHNYELKNVKNPELNESVINELFDTDANITWDRKESYRPRAYFTVNNTDYRVEFQYLDGKRDAWAIMYDIRFRDDDDAYEPTGDMGMDAKAVLGHVIKSVEEFIEYYNPNNFFFDGDKNNKLGQLYSVMVRRLAAKIKSAGYELEQKDKGYAQDFKFTKVKPLDEAFNTTTEIEWTERAEDAHVGEFTVGENHFQIEFLSSSPDLWKLYYSAMLPDGDLSFKPTGFAGRDAIKVLSIVSNALLDFIKSEQPKMLRFSGDKHDKLGSLYTMMAKNLLPRLNAVGYTIQNKDAKMSAYFSIIKMEQEQ